MDVSTLFTAPATAASTAALSFGAMGGAAAPGEGGDGLDSFNQLLGNFLALTGGMVPEGAAATDGLMPVAADGAASPSQPQGMTGLFQGLNLTTAMAGTGMQGGKALEGRWAQSGLNLLAGSALAGQELNQEVVAFLNDLSTAITAEGAPTEGEISLDLAVESVGEDEAEAATLLLAEGEAPAQPLPILNAALPVVITPSVIPRDTVQQTPGSLGMTLTVTGTGLQALPTVPASEETTTPAAAPIIPRLATAPVAPTAPFIAAAPTAPVAPAPVLVATTEEAAATAAAANAAEAAEPLVAAPDQPVTAAATPSATATNVASPAAKPVADQRVAAIALPAELAATAQADETPVPAAMVAKLAQAATPAENTAPVVTPVARSAARPAGAAIAQPLPASPVTDTPAPATQAVTTAVTARAEATAAAEVAADADEAASATPAAPTLAAATNAAPRPQAQPVATPSPRLEAVKANPVEVAALPAEPAADLPVETPDMATDEPATQAAAATPAAGPARPAAAPVRPAVTSPAHVQAAAGQPAPEAEMEADLADAPVQEEEATNNRMLAPRHVGAEAVAEMQDGIAGQAQSAGQNQTGTRDAAVPTVNGEREDNLLARAVTAAAKGSESKSAGDEGSSFYPDPGTPPETLDGVTGTAQMSEPGKAQGTDFAQSLRQTTAPHRPGAYMPPTQQMAFHVQRAVQEGNDRLSIRLNPQELGRIDVQLEIGAEGKLRAKVMVENPQTLEMLQKDSKHLEKALQDAGLQTDQNSLSFSLQDSGDQARERQDQREQSGHGTGIASEDVEQEDPAIIAQAQMMELGRVDVRV